MSPTELTAFLLLGAFAGVLAGLLGVGGGLVIVPVLAFIFKARDFDAVMHLAVGTSLATIVFTSLSSVRAHHRRGAVRWDLFLRLAPGIVGGALAGAAIADRMPGEHLRLVFGIFELLVAVQMALSVRPAPNRQLPGAVGMGLAGGGIGSVSAIVGIGGGTLTVPFLAWCNVPMRNAVATSAACGLPIAIAGAAGFVWAGWAGPGLPEYTLGYVYLPALAAIVAASVLFAPLGAWLAHAVPAAALKRFFALFLAILGLRMLLYG